jgi:hypothetical protein
MRGASLVGGPPWVDFQVPLPQPLLLLPGGLTGLDAPEDTAHRDRGRGWAHRLSYQAGCWHCRQLDAITTRLSPLQDISMYFSSIRRRPRAAPPRPNTVDAAWMAAISLPLTSRSVPGARDQAALD